MNKFLYSNTLYVLSGPQGSGKSTFFKKNNIPNSMIISADKIRKEILGSIKKIDEYGVYDSLDGNSNVYVFKIVEALLESKLKNGTTTFLDATNLTDSARKSYVQLAKKYNMDTKILIFGADLTLEQMIDNNAKRETRVPKYNIEKYYEKMEFNSSFDYELVNFNDMYEIVPKFEINKDIELSIIGDVHGLKNELIKLLDKEEFFIENNTIKHNNPNKKVLFIGDIIDRGNDSIEILKIVKNSIEKENHYIVLGNHENKLLKMYNNYINKESTGMFESSEAVSRTFSEFLKLSVKEQESLINFYNKQPYYYIYKDNIIVHANIENSNLDTLTRNTCLYGDEGNSDKVYKELYDKGINSYKLIRGHIPILDKNDVVISLEDEAVSLGNLLMYNAHTKELFKEKSSFNYEKDSAFYNGKNLIWKLKELESFPIDKFNKQGNLVGSKNIPLISYKEHENGTMRIYKYSKQVFFQNLWDKDPLLLKARGLVLDGNGQIVQHPFDKVFNFSENGSGLDIPNDKEVYAVEKFNGFLGCITLHNNDLLVTTTGSFDSDFVGYIKDFFANKNFEHYDKDLRQNIFKFLRKEDLTLMFEVIHPNDPHIIKYDSNEMGLKLIGARGKSFNSRELKEERLDFIANEINVKRADYFKIKFGELKGLVKNSTLEGFMVRDVDTQKTLLKFKTPYYLTTKFIGRMSSANIEFMYSNPNKFKEKVDEEYYELIDLIFNNVDKDYFLKADNLDKIELVRNLINEQRENLELDRD